MEIIGKEKYLKEGKNIGKTVGNLNALTKALILTYKATNQEENYKKLKEEYLGKIVPDATKRALENRSEEEKKQIFMLEELELEIQQKKVEVIKKSLKGE